MHGEGETPSDRRTTMQPCIDVPDTLFGRRIPLQVLRGSELRRRLTRTFETAGHVVEPEEGQQERHRGHPDRPVMSALRSSSRVDLKPRAASQTQTGELNGAILNS